MTEKLYDKDAYLKEFEAKVISCEESPKGYGVVLDKTCFFPEEGGQTPDLGLLNGIKVEYVSIDKGIITHYLESPLKVGETVKGAIDFEHRFSNMQMHSAEHIFSGFVHAEFGYDNVGFHLSDNDATMDYNGKLSPEDIVRLEKKVNMAIYEAHKIRTWYPEAQKLMDLDYRFKSGIEGDVRMVEIEGIDLCACCAPHVLDTSQIGLFKIVRYESYKGGIRLHYLAGKRAFEYFVFLYDTVTDISRNLSSSMDKVSDCVKKMIEDNKNLSFETNALKREIIENKLSEIKIEDGSLFYFFLPGENVSLLRFTIDLMQSIYKGICIVLCKTAENNYRFIVESKEKDIKELTDSFCTKFNTKCGGKNNSVQGSVNATREELEIFLAAKE